MFAAVILLTFTPLPDLGRDPPLPPASDLARFPDAKTAESRHAFLSRQECALHHEEKSPERDNAIRQIEYALDCWGTLQAAHDSKTERERRQNLQQLNVLLGDMNYRRGQMP
jgi:hypothetical protein